MCLIGLLVPYPLPHHESRVEAVSQPTTSEAL